MTGAPVRVAPRPRDDWDDAVRDALRAAFVPEVAERFLSTGPDALAVPNAITAMLHHPALAGPWLTFNNVLLWSSTLEPRWRELMVLRVAWRTRSNYEWLQHVRLAPRFGITADEIDAVVRGDGEWTALEAALLAATDQLLDHYRIDDDTWARLAGHLDVAQLVELVFVVGAYSTLSMAFKSFDVALEDGMDTIAAPLPDAPA